MSGGATLDGRLGVAGVRVLNRAVSCARVLLNALSFGSRTAPPPDRSPTTHTDYFFSSYSIVRKAIQIMKFAHNSTDPEPALKTSETRLAPRRRLALWAITVIATLTAPLWCLLPQLNIIGAAQAFAGLAIFLQLLKTTPPDAIKLPWGASAAIILLGAAAMPAIAHAQFHPVAMIAPVILAMLLIAILFHPRSPMSPWWATLVVWHPAFWAVFQPGLVGWNAEAILIRAALLFAAAIILGAANAWRTAILWSLAAISAAVTLLAMLMSAGSTGVPPV